MRPCITGIGGTGGKILKVFLESQDVLILGKSLGEHMAFGGIKGVWMDSDTSIPIEDKKFYTGRLVDGHYPGIFVPHDVLKGGSKVYTYIREKYGYDLSRPGYDRRAEYLKAIFEIFQTDQVAKALSEEEYSTKDNPLFAYTWSEGISRFTSFKKSDQSPSMNEKEPGDANKVSGVFGSLGRISPLNGTTKTARSEEESKGCKSLLFIASLGGGTGTGFINPLTNYIRSKGSFAAVALCVFTEKGPDSKQTPEGQRDLGAVIAMYDILTKKTGEGIDGLILIDNQILQGLFGERNYSAMNRAIFDMFKPFIDPHNFPDVKDQDESLGMQRVFSENLKLPGVLIPCYSSGDTSKSEKDLAEGALSTCKLSNGKLEGILFPCDFKKADHVYVFARGLLDRNLLHEELQKKIGKDEEGKDKVIYVYPKLGETNSREILILLRNPYGGKTRILSRDNCGKPCSKEETWNKEIVSESFEQRIYCSICMGLKYLVDNETNIIQAGMPDITKISLGNYLFGEDWIERNLKLLQEKTDLEDEEQKYKERLEEAKSKSSKEKLPFLVKELEKSMERLKNGEKPFFDRELTIFREDKSEVNNEGLMDLIESGIKKIMDKKIVEIVDKRIEEKVYVD